MQGQIGNRGVARSVFRESETGFGYRSLRQMILSVRKNADRIRLTALPKPIFSSKGRVPRVPLFIFCKNELVELVPPAISFSSRSGWHPAAKIFSAIKPQVHLNCPAGPRRGGKSHPHQPRSYEGRVRTANAGGPGSQRDGGDDRSTTGSTAR